MTNTALDLFEIHRVDYLNKARDAARKILANKQTITTDDVREACPVPEGVNPKVMGAVFNHPDFKSTGTWVKSRRTIAHNRPIQVFRLSDGR